MYSPIIFRCCHSNHLTFPSQSRPNETTGGQQEKQGGERVKQAQGKAEIYHRKDKQHAGRIAIILYLLYAHMLRSPSNSQDHSGNKSRGPASQHLLITTSAPDRTTVCCLGISI
ncbi:hypothetical protein GOODEAATRI_001304 [Goodea atripinnis]|uniref:Uncharacterized protein n=1 Tax=Goodea atripinnis TaxID=208336 RepID=A0ABV0MXT2_9TELE